MAHGAQTGKNRGRQNRSRPQVIANFAISADGKISTRTLAPSGFTSPRDKKRLQEIRARGDAILVGRRTLETDRMGLTVSRDDLREARLERGQSQFPLRVILTSLGKVSSDWPVFHREGGPILLATRDKPAAWRRASWRKAVEIYSRPRLSIRGLLEWLHQEKGVQTLVCEGGAALLRQILAEDLLDELHLTLAPLLFGGEDAPTLTGPPGDFLPAIARFELIEARPVGDEVFCHFRRDRSRE